MRGQRAPFSMFLVVSLIGCALLAWLTQNKSLLALAMIDPQAQPWSLITYPWAFSPLASMFGLIFLLFMSMLVIQLGGSIEREMGSGRFAAFWLVFTLLPGLVGLAAHVPLSEPWLPLSALIVAWGARNRSATMMLYGIIPLNGVWLAALAAASILFVHGSSNPLVGVAMVLPLGLAWLFASNMLPLAFAGGSSGSSRSKFKVVVKGGTKYDDSYFENVKDREIERAERERLRKLFEGK